MNLLNRLLIILLLLALAAGAVAVVVLAWVRPDESIASLRDAVNWLDDNNETLQRIVLTSVGLLIALLALSALIFELVPHAGMEVKVTDVRAGDAMLSTVSIGQRVDEAVREVPHVAESRSVVRAKRKGVMVSLDLHVEPEANLAEVANNASDAIKAVLSEKVHVRLLEPPKIRLHYRELRLRRPERRLEPAASAAEEEVTPPAADTSADDELRENGEGREDWARAETAAAEEDRREEERQEA